MERAACCHCGSLRATVTGEPTVVNVCHCKACQRRTGAVMHSGVYFAKSQVRIEGPEKVYTRDAQEGRKISFHFCPTCGSSVYWDFDLRPEHYASRWAHLRIRIFHHRPTQSGKIPSTPGSICRMESSIIVRVATGKPHIFSCCGRNEYCFPCPTNQHHLDCCNAHCMSAWGQLRSSEDVRRMTALTLEADFTGSRCD